MNISNFSNTSSGSAGKTAAAAAAAAASASSPSGAKGKVGNEFSVLCYPFHNGAITGVDVCHRKPLGEESKYYIMYLVLYTYCSRGSQSMGRHSKVGGERVN